MNYIFRFLLLLLLLNACSSEHGNMLVNGKIKGFQKGTLYLEKIQDTLLIKVDSVSLDGKNTFTMSDDVQSPQIYFLSIGGTDKILQFFGEKGTISITSALKTFGYAPKITGSKNQEMLDVYRETTTKFNNQHLDLVKEKFEAMKIKDTAKANEIAKRIANIPRRKYLYTAYFAVNHANLEVAPYLALSEIYDANPSILDTIVNSLSSEVSKSLYGKKLIDYLAEVKTKIAK